MRNNPTLLLFVSCVIVFVVSVSFLSYSFIVGFLGNEVQNVSITNLKAVELPYIKEITSSAKAMCVLEQNSKRVLYGKNIHEKLPMASTTKVFTALMILNLCEDLDSLIEIPDDAVGIEGTSMYLQKGDKFSTRELLYGMMLPSGNDAATALALHFGGTMENFCNEMNIFVQNLGAYDTHFMNSHGLDEKNHYTSAYDLALIGSIAMKNDDFREISKTESIAVYGGQNEEKILINKNKLLKRCDFCTGIKIGFTDNAGRCFLSSGENENLSVVASVLNCPDMFEECERLMNLAFDEFNYYEILKPYNVSREMEVKKGKKQNVNVFTQKSFSYPLTKSELQKLELKYVLPDYLVAPIKENENVGVLEIYLEDKKIFEEKIFSMGEVKSSSFFVILKELLKDFI